MPEQRAELPFDEASAKEAACHKYGRDFTKPREYRREGFIEGALWQARRSAEQPEGATPPHLRDDNEACGECGIPWGNHQAKGVFHHSFRPNVQSEVAASESFAVKALLASGERGDIYLTVEQYRKDHPGALERAEAEMIAEGQLPPREIQQSFRPITKDLFIRALRAYNNNQVASERRLSDAVAILNEGIAGQALHEVSD